MNHCDIPRRSPMVAAGLVVPPWPLTARRVDRVTALAYAYSRILISAVACPWTWRRLHPHPSD